MSKPPENSFRDYVRQIERYIIPQRKSRWNFVIITLAVTMAIIFAGVCWLLWWAATNPNL